LLVYTRSNALANVVTIPYKLAEVYGLGILKSVTFKRTVVVGRNDNIVHTELEADAGSLNLLESPLQNSNSVSPYFFVKQKQVIDASA